MSSAAEEPGDAHIEGPLAKGTDEAGANAENDTARWGPVPLGGNMRAYREYEFAEIVDAFNEDNHEKTEELLKEALLDPHLPLYFRSRYETMLAALCGSDWKVHTNNALEILDIMEEDLKTAPDVKESHHDYIRKTRATLMGYLTDGLAEEEQQYMAKDGDANDGDAQNEPPAAEGKDQDLRPRREEGR